MNEAMVLCRGGLVVSGLALLCLSTGCGTGEYESRMRSRLDELWQADSLRPKVFLRDLYGYIEPENALANGRVNLRVPEAFEVVWSEGAVDPNTGQPLDERRLYPAGVELPGYNRTYEALVNVPDDPDGRQLRYFLYLAADRTAPGTLEQIAAELIDMFKQAAPSTPDQWESIEIENQADGEIKTWVRMRIGGEFFFHMYKSGQHVGWQKQPAVIRLYLYEGEGHFVILASKTPEELLGVALMEEYLPMIASTVMIDDTNLPPLDSSDPQASVTHLRSLVGISNEPGMRVRQPVEERGAAVLSVRRPYWKAGLSWPLRRYSSGVAWISASSPVW